MPFSLSSYLLGVGTCKALSGFVFGRRGAPYQDSDTDDPVGVKTGSSGFKRAEFHPPPGASCELVEAKAIPARPPPAELRRRRRDRTVRVKRAPAP